MVIFAEIIEKDISGHRKFNLCNIYAGNSAVAEHVFISKDWGHNDRMSRSKNLCDMSHHPLPVETPTTRCTTDCCTYPHRRRSIFTPNAFSFARWLFVIAQYNVLR